MNRLIFYLLSITLSFIFLPNVKSIYSHEININNTNPNKLINSIWEEKINLELLNLNYYNGYSMAVVTIDKISPFYQTPEIFASEVFDNLKLKNDILLFTSLKPRKVIIIAGNNTSNILTSSIRKTIIDKIKPYLQEEKYGKAGFEGVVLLKTYLKSNLLRYFWLIIFFFGFSILYRLFKKQIEKTKKIKINEKIQEFINIGKEVKEGLLCQPETCSICLNTMHAIECLEITNCNHIYHSNCIKHWLRRKDNCPICRQKIKRTVIRKNTFDSFISNLIVHERRYLEWRWDRYFSYLIYENYTFGEFLLYSFRESFENPHQEYEDYDSDSNFIEFLESISWEGLGGGELTSDNW
ncbi:TPM domain [seawater metagenome]|uniref:TPM domain n=1 Tax=seawater metagenome TaxID=1561972 RepID=A0A5E8CIL1_9ZZZZ